MLVEAHAYYGSELFTLSFLLIVALVSSYIPGFVTSHLDKARKRAEQEAVDAAPVDSPAAARKPIYGKT